MNNSWKSLKRNYWTIHIGSSRRNFWRSPRKTFLDDSFNVLFWSIFRRNSWKIPRRTCWRNPRRIDEIPNTILECIQQKFLGGIPEQILEWIIEEIPAGIPDRTSAAIPESKPRNFLGWGQKEFWKISEGTSNGIPENQMKKSLAKLLEKS